MDKKLADKVFGIQKEISLQKELKEIYSSIEIVLETDTQASRIAERKINAGIQELLTNAKKEINRLKVQLCRLK